MDGTPFSKPLPEIWREMERLVELGLVRSIGVSNFRKRDLQSLLSSRPAMRPCVNQVERHPRLRQEDLASYCASEQIALAAYGPLSPLTCDDTAKDTGLMAVIESVAQAHDASAEQVLLAWSLQGGFVTVTTTWKPERLPGMRAATALRLSAEEVAALDDAGDAAPLRTYWQVLDREEE